jgi:hypothetical protein
MTEWQRFIDKFYDFAELCYDDYDIMVRALKLAGMKRRPNIIRKNIEELEENKQFCSIYMEYFSKVDHDIAIRAKRIVQLERGSQATLF